MDLILDQLKCHSGGGEQVSTSEEEKILDLLKQLTIKVKTNDDDNRSKLNAESFKIIQSILELGTPSLTIECFRFLRNAVAFSPKNQNIIFESTTLLQWASKYLGDDDKDIESRRICLQFIINCTVGNERNAEFVALNANYISKYFSQNIAEVGYLLNTILNLLPSFSTVVFADPSLFHIILENPDTESHIILLETLASNTDFLSSIYCQLSETQQLSYIQFLSASQCRIHLKFFASLFKSKADYILKSNLDKLEAQFQEITALLSLISSSNQIDMLSDDQALVTTAIHLLQLTNQCNLFNPIEKLSQVTEEHQNHPTFLFKANLIRLLGNLAHNHQQNQTLIGGSCLETILNCTRIDALNPFITQWSILAIRNLLHTHNENQTMVANLKLQSSAYSSVLQEFGISVKANANDNTVKIMQDKKP